MSWKKLSIKKKTPSSHSGSFPNQKKSLKRGDDTRLKLMTLVKEGEICFLFHSNFSSWVFWMLYMFLIKFQIKNIYKGTHPFLTNSFPVLKLCRSFYSLFTDNPSHMVNPLFCLLSKLPFLETFYWQHYSNE